MAKKQIEEAQNPLILRCNRLIEAFSKSDDERDFYLDRKEGYIIYVDLDKSSDDIELLEKELRKNPDNFCIIPKLTFYESKKIMEGFINEKVYDIDTKEKLLDIIQSKEARENFLEFIHDHHSELEKWQAYYQERSRIRIIEWLRANGFTFVFEEDLELPKLLLEKIKKELFDPKASKEVVNARKSLIAKAKTYYSSEALNPRPKRGRPPKQAIKAEIEPQIALDIYTTVPNNIRSFLFVPELNSSSFSTRFGTEDDHHSHRRHSHEMNTTLENLNTKLLQLRTLTSKWKEGDDNISRILEGSPKPKPVALESNNTSHINGTNGVPIQKAAFTKKDKKPEIKNKALSTKNVVKAKEVKTKPLPSKKLKPNISSKTQKNFTQKTNQNNKPKQKEKTMTTKAKSAAPKKAAAKKAPAKKATVKKAPAKKASVKKPAAKKSAAKKSK